MAVQTVSTKLSRREIEDLGSAYLKGHDIAGTRQAAEMAAAYVDHVQREFRKLTKKIRVEFTDRDPYESLEAMAADVSSNKHMWVYTGFSDVPLWSPEVNWKARAVHDYDHIRANTDFSLEGEIHAFQVAAGKVPELEPLYLSEIALQAAAFAVDGAFPDAQRFVIPEAHVARIARTFRRNEDLRGEVWDLAGALKHLSPDELMTLLGANGVPFEDALRVVVAAETASDLSGAG